MAHPKARSSLRAALLTSVVVFPLVAGCPKDCPEGTVKQDGACVAACNSEVDCKRTEVCRDGVCVESAGTSSGGVVSSSSASVQVTSSPASGGGSSTSTVTSSSSRPGSSSQGVATDGGTPDAAMGADGGGNTDGGGVVDAATLPDAASIPDASMASDASSMPDSATIPDAAMIPDAATIPDAAMPAALDAGNPGERNAPCLMGMCGGSLACDYSQLLSTGLVAATKVCHQACVYGYTGGANQCPATGDRCLPSLTTLQGAQYSVQAVDGGSVPCSLDGGTECNTALGFSCRALSTTGPVCSRLAGACGTPVLPWDLTPTMTRSPSDYCNTGSPSYVPGTSLVVGGSQFCDPLDNLVRPPWVFCEPLAGSTVGTCTAACAIPQSDGTIDQRDCPTGYACDLGVSTIVRAIQPYQPCVLPAECPSGALCAGPFPQVDGGSLCARRYGICQPSP